MIVGKPDIDKSRDVQWVGGRVIVNDLRSRSSNLSSNVFRGSCDSCQFCGGV